MSFWTRINTTQLFKHSRISLVEDTVRLSDGNKTQYLRYEALPDYATVIACRDSKIAFIKEYSYPLDRFLMQFPEGSMEVGERALDCAKRELQEEAGLASNKYRELGCSPADHRRSTVLQFVVVATEVYEVEKSGGDIEERGTETVWVDESVVDKMIARGEITQKNALAAWAIFKATSLVGQPTENDK